MQRTMPKDKLAAPPEVQGDDPSARLDYAFRSILTVPKEALRMEEKRLKNLRLRKRARDKAKKRK